MKQITLANGNSALVYDATIGLSYEDKVKYQNHFHYPLYQTSMSLLAEWVDKGTKGGYKDYIIPNEFHLCPLRSFESMLLQQGVLLQGQVASISDYFKSNPAYFRAVSLCGEEAESPEELRGIVQPMIIILRTEGKTTEDDLSNQSEPIVPNDITSIALLSLFLSKHFDISTIIYSGQNADQKDIVNIEFSAPILLDDEEAFYSIRVPLEGNYETINEEELLNHCKVHVEVMCETLITMRS